MLRVWFTDWLINFILIDYFAVTIGLILIQLVLASLYKSFFKQGPLEYIWRKLVFRKAERFRLHEQ